MTIRTARRQGQLQRSREAGDGQAGRPQVVMVTGDVTIDWNLAQQRLRRPETPAGTRASWQRGGAALLSDLMKEIGSSLGEERPIRISGIEPPYLEPPEEPPIPPDDGRWNHRYALWSQFPRTEGDKEKQAWRIASFLGVDASRSDEVIRSEWKRLEKDLPQADIIALDDAALGFRHGSQVSGDAAPCFRDLSEPDLWHRVMARSPRPWVVLRSGQPLADGPLWKHLLTECPDRLVVVIRINDLRETEVQVSRELSWERTAQDLFWELVHNPIVNTLSRVAHTVVSFGTAGAAWISGPRDPDETPTCSLIFDPKVIEGEWEAQHPAGTAAGVMGTTNSLVAAVLREIVLAPDAPEFERGIQAGVAAARRLRIEGFQERGLGRMELGFPHALVAGEIADVTERIAAGGEPPFQRLDVPYRVTRPSSPKDKDPEEPSVGRARLASLSRDEDRYWTILQDRHAGNLAESAVQTAIHGPERALPGVPLATFGALITADRSEIEAFRTIRGLIAEYVRTRQSKPLSIAVFGPPGAGKSFGVMQVARSVAGAQMGEPLEFNLSQFRSPDELADAFHRARDVGLRGQVPLIFWDEFDASLQGRPLGWLRYFLAPMQDGEFVEGQITHPIGQCIFVFAGGTCQRVQEFGSAVDKQTFREVKGTDFVSRLKGYVNVLGPNPYGEGDRNYLIRRAIMLRQILRKRAPKLFEGDTLHIDPGVLRAFLEIGQYRHGTRSLEAIVTMSLLSGETAYERSSLPAEPQLDLHVNGREFLDLVGRMDLAADLVEQLARNAHQMQCEWMEANGYVFGPQSDDELKVSSYLIPFESLPQYRQERYRGSVRHIHAKLERIDCVMVPTQAGLEPFAFTDEEVEELAREEHEQWMASLGEGWHYGKPTDESRKISRAYLPWDELEEAVRERNRRLVREIPHILAGAGYAVVRLPSGAESGPRA